MYKLILNPSEKDILISLHRTLKNKKQADKVKCIILLSEGYTHKQVAEILLLEERTVYRYKVLFKKSLDDLLNCKYRGRPTKLTADQERELSIYLTENLYSSAKEITVYIKTKYNVDFTHDGLVITLHRLGFSYKKTKSIPAKADKEKQKAFIQAYIELRSQLKPDEKIYFMDAVHPTHNSVSAYGWIKTGTEKRIKANTGRQRLNINGLYSPIDNEIIIRDDKTINSESTIELFKTVEVLHPELSGAYVISDNARYYYSKLVKEYLLGSKIKLVNLPSYSPNLNLIERLWKYLKKKIIYNKYYETFSEFRKAIYDFFENMTQTMKEELTTLMTEKFHLLDSG